jgi:4-alpha-glucanotransferase
VIATLGLGEEMGRLSTLPRVDWVAATPQRQKLLRGLFDALRDPARGLEAPRTDFERHLAEASPLLKAHAVFEVLHETELRRDPAAWNWRNWQPGFRGPESPDVAAFAAAHQKARSLIRSSCNG